jgi:hypothetical protein
MGSGLHTPMIHIERYRCVAASLLRSVCMHARPELKDTDLKQLSYISRMVSTTNPSYYVSCVQCANYAKAETCFHFLKKLIQPATQSVPNYIHFNFSINHFFLTSVKFMEDVSTSTMSIQFHQTL